MSISINRTKISEPFETLLELLSVVIFHAEIKADISDRLVSFYKVMLLKIWCMVDLMTAYYLFYKLKMDALIFSE